MLKIENTPWHSRKVGNLAKGCRQCVRGQKLVLFVTGLCSRRCYFCPLSEHKQWRDVVYANERPVLKDEDIRQEASVCEAKGAGITGGDPLLAHERTCRYIRLLKGHFGKHFHIHIYLPLTHVTQQLLQDLHDAGVDEVRFHPAYERPDDWDRIQWARRYEWDIGIEVPVIPGYEEALKGLLDYTKDWIDFLNLNEFEMSETNSEAMESHGLDTVDQYSYAIEGSQATALQLLQHAQAYGIPTHYCTTTLKDRVQLAQRIKRRARNAAHPYEKITEEGLLLLGAVFSEQLVPGSRYQEKLRLMSLETRDSILSELEEIKQKLQKRLAIPERFIRLNRDKLRVETRPALLKKIARTFAYTTATVEEYPTWDRLEVEVDFNEG